ncbi:DUF2845 domain-containing protein [Zavarzinia sp. CC-PAN008]|uniref:DUF2845 domain-containing protein n=1 Tax=Zavarzinia sp. CC-PAN008 TaxID=3243332 RepID=UPI003F742B7C
MAAALAAVSAGLAGAPPLRADPPIRCAERIVDLGMPDFEVRRLCGPPDGISPFSVQRFVALEPGRGGGVAAGSAVVVQGERWDYAARNGRLSRTLLFEAGRLVRIDVGGF